MDNIIHFKYIVIRKEYKENEYRVALIPSDCKKIIDKNEEECCHPVSIYVEKSNTRCFTDLEYINAGCVLIDNYIELAHPIKDMLIVGLKELPMTEYMYSYNHLYFSHCFKNQENSNTILQLFKLKGGNIYDLEYFTDGKKRLVSFGFSSGLVGCYLGLLQYYYRKQYMNICDLNPFKYFEDLFNKILAEKNSIYNQPTIAIIGNGRCASGCMSLLNILELPYKIYNRSLSKTDLNKYNIIINCIVLTEYIEPFITTESLHSFNNTDVIVDISCDYNNINNPLPIYNNSTSFKNPIHKIGSIDLIAIDNLPSLLPKDSSTDFSNELVKIINNNYILWKNNLNNFKNKIN